MRSSAQGDVHSSGAAGYAAAGAAALAALILVLSSSMGLKWFFVSCVGLMAAITAVVFPNFRLFMVLLLTACIPVAIQYNLFDQGNKYVILDHFGGAQGELVVSLVDFPIAGLLLLWVVDLASARINLPKWERIDTYILLFILVSGLSLFNTDEYALFAFEELRYLKYYLLLWILRSYLALDRRFVVYSLYVVGVVAGGEFLLASLQYFLFFTLPFPVGGVSGSQFDMVNNVVIQRVSGTVGHCNTFAAYLLFPIIVSFAFLISRSPLLIRLIAGVLFVGCGAALVLTFSRNAWMTASIAVALLCVVGIFTRRISPPLVFGVMGLGMVLIAGLAFTEVFEIIIVRIFEDDGKAYDSRWDLAMVALQMLMEHPLLGIGLNSFEETMSYYDDSGVTNIIQQPVHNALLLIAAETGLLALALFLLICKNVANYVMRVIRQGDEFGFIVGVSTGVIFIALIISNQFDLTLRKEPIIGMCVLFIAMVMAGANPAPTTRGDGK